MYRLILLSPRKLSLAGKQIYECFVAYMKWVLETGVVICIGYYALKKCSPFYHEEPTNLYYGLYLPS